MKYAQVRLHLLARLALVVAAIGYLDDLEVPANRIWPKLLEEFLCDGMSKPEKISRPTSPHLKISVVGKLVQVPHNTQ